MSVSSLSTLQLTAQYGSGSIAAPAVLVAAASAQPMQLVVKRSYKPMISHNIGMAALFSHSGGLLPWLTSCSMLCSLAWKA
jgi:hypothetical protein